MVTFDWADAASRLLKGEIARTGITLAQLAGRLRGLDLQETEASLKNKLYRGTFSLTFFMQCMRALGRSSVEIDAVVAAEVPRGTELDPASKT